MQPAPARRLKAKKHVTLHRAYGCLFRRLHLDSSMRNDRGPKPGRLRLLHLRRVFLRAATALWRDVLDRERINPRNDLDETCTRVDRTVGFLRFRVGPIPAAHVRRGLLDLVPSRSWAESVSYPGGAWYFVRRSPFRKNAPLSAADLFVTADNLFTLYVNGKLAGQSHANPNLWHRPKRFDVSKLLLPGRNVIAVEADQHRARPGRPAGEIPGTNGRRATAGLVSAMPPGRAATRRKRTGSSPPLTTNRGARPTWSASYGCAPWGRFARDLAKIPVENPWPAGQPPVNYQRMISNQACAGRARRRAASRKPCRRPIMPGRKRSSSWATIAACIAATKPGTSHDSLGVTMFTARQSRAYPEHDLPSPIKMGRKLYVLEAGPAGHAAAAAARRRQGGHRPAQRLVRRPVDLRGHGPRRRAVLPHLPAAGRGRRAAAADRRPVPRHRSGRTARRPDRVHLDADRHVRGIPQSAVAGAVHDERRRRRHPAAHQHVHLRQRAAGAGRRADPLHPLRQLLRPRQGRDAAARRASRRHATATPSSAWTTARNTAAGCGPSTAAAPRRCPTAAWPSSPAAASRVGRPGSHARIGGTSRSPAGDVAALPDGRLLCTVARSTVHARRVGSKSAAVTTSATRKSSIFDPAGPRTKRPRALRLARRAGCIRRSISARGRGRRSCRTTIDLAAKPTTSQATGVLLLPERALHQEHDRRLAARPGHPRAGGKGPDHALVALLHRPRRQRSDRVGHRAAGARRLVRRRSARRSGHRLPGRGRRGAIGAERDVVDLSCGPARSAAAWAATSRGRPRRRTAAPQALALQPGR